MGAVDARLDLEERERLRHEQPGSDLELRRARLPEGHPSADGYVDSRRDREPERVRPLTDAEYADHVTDIKTRLDEARREGRATFIQHTKDRGHEVWSEERELQHNTILDDMCAKAREVPCEWRAIVAGGLAGSGKTSVLREYAGVDLGRFLVINPDSIKEELASRGLVPKVEGLSPLEAADLVHEESSHIAKRLAQRAAAEGKNVAWDITMSSGASTEKRLQSLQDAGYSHIEGIFVDVSIDVSMQRVESRHREGLERFRNGDGLGGRFVADQLILAQADPDWGSRNRRSFEMLKSEFTAWSIFENSVDGRKPSIAETGRSDLAEPRGNMTN